VCSVGQLPDRFQRLASIREDERLSRPEGHGGTGQFFDPARQAREEHEGDSEGCIIGQDPIGVVKPFAYRLASAVFAEKIIQMKSSTQDKVEGTAKDLAGSVKEVTGKAVGNERLQAAGHAEKIEGKVQRKVGEIKKVLGS
jgi:uncharacterized protein YjbJ (UPF0337 family)